VAPQFWPYPTGAAEGRARLYEDGRFATPDGRARFADTPYQAVAEPRDARFPFALNTGRLRDQWHGMSRTGTVPRLFGHASEPAIDMHASDMARLKLNDGDLVHVTSRRGSLILPARSSPQIAPAQCFIAMHWGEEFLSGRANTGEPLAGVNGVTSPAYCPQSKQPELKHSAVKVLKAELPWQLLAMAWFDADQALHARTRLKPLMGTFAFASCVSFGRERSGVLFRAADDAPPSRELLRSLEALLGLDSDGVLRYADPRRGQWRSMNLQRHGNDAALQGFMLAGDTRAETWVAPLLQDQLPAKAFGRLLLVPGAKAPATLVARGKQVCNCFDVSQDQIDGVLAEAGGAPEKQLARLQERLQCGTNCGSCLPELKRIVRLHQAVA